MTSPVSKPHSRYIRATDWIAENFALLLPGVALGAILGAVLLHWSTA